MRNSDRLGGSACRSSWVERATRGTLSASSRMSAPAAWGGVVVGLALSWLVAHIVGGAGVAAPHLVLHSGAVRGGAVWLPGRGCQRDGRRLARGAAAPPRRGRWCCPAAWRLAHPCRFLRDHRAGDGARDRIEPVRDEGRVRANAHGTGAGAPGSIVASSSSTTSRWSVFRPARSWGSRHCVRWQHPEWGLVLPARFIAEAETSGLIVGLGEQALDMACRQLLAWRSGPLRNHQSFQLAVNVSARQLVDPGLVAHVAGMIRTLGIEPSWLLLEVTETALVTDVEGSTARLAELKALGVALAIDDFGTGNAALSYLHRYPVDVVKIDRSFVASHSVGRPSRRSQLRRDPATPRPSHRNGRGGRRS